MTHEPQLKNKLDKFENTNPFQLQVSKISPYQGKIPELFTKNKELFNLYTLAHEYQNKNKNEDFDDEISDSELFEDYEGANLTKQSKTQQVKHKTTTSLDTLMPTKLLPKPEALPQLDNYSECSSEIQADHLLKQQQLGTQDTASLNFVTDELKQKQQDLKEKQKYLLEDQ